MKSSSDPCVQHSEGNAAFGAGIKIMYSNMILLKK